MHFAVHPQRIIGLCHPCPHAWRLIDESG
jgi:hypothetical protein